MGFDALAAFLSLPGWRLGEALALRWAQVDFTAGVIRLSLGPRRTARDAHSPLPNCPNWRPSCRLSRPRRAQ